MSRFCLYLIVLILLQFINSGYSKSKFWQSYQFGTGVGNREELVITDIKLNENFNFGENVTIWKSISCENYSFAVGFSLSRLFLLKVTLDEENQFQFSSSYVDEEDVINDITLISHFDSKSDKYEAILVIAIGTEYSQLKWFKIENQTINHFWTWQLHEKVYYLDQQEIDGNYKLFTISQRNSKNAILNIYDYSLFESSNPDQFWLNQYLKLDYVTRNLVFTVINEKVFLSLSQTENNQIVIYKFLEEHFSFYQNITKHDITSLTSFKIGPKAYLAVGGEESALYAFNTRGIFPEIIPNFNDEQIELWLPLTANTYRDEVLLILQRNIHHSSHNAISFEVLMFNGIHFNFLNEISCLYFGEELRGLNCLNENGRNGIFGATIISIRNELGILLPKKSGNSEFFDIDMELKVIPSPLEQLLAEKEELEKLLSNPKLELQHFSQAKSRGDLDDIDISEPNETKFQQTDEIMSDNMKNQLETASLMIEEIRDRLKNVITIDQQDIVFQELIINGSLEVQGETKVSTMFLNNINNEPAHAAFNDIVNLDSIGTFTGAKTFSDIQVENITFKTLNDIEAENIAYINNNPLIIRGDLIFEDSVVVDKNLNVITKRVNDIVLEDEIVTSSNILNNCTLKFSNLKINGNLYTNRLNIENEFFVENINGINITDFINSVCYLNESCFIDDNINIDGEIEVEELKINNLNNLKFPDEYVFKNSTDFVTITGTKFFTGTVTAEEVYVEEKLNGINPNNILTCTSNQTLNGNFTFSNLKIMEKITVDGKIIEPHVTPSVKNPSLLETNETNSNIQFKRLKVEGNVIIKGNFNGIPFESILEDVIYKDDSNAVIESIKTFPKSFTVNKGLNILSNTINGIPLNDFVTKDTNQELSLQTLNGNVVIENAFLSGLYGDINITKMVEEAVRLSGNQFISSELIFNNEENPNNSTVNLETNELEIMDSLNGEQIQYFLNNVDGVAISTSELGELKAEVVEVEGFFECGETNFDFENFEKNRLSISKDQNIGGHFVIGESHVDELEAATINNIIYSQLFDPESYTDFLTQQLIAGRLQILELEVENMFTEKLNGDDLNIIFLNDNFLVNNFSLGNDLIVENDILLDHIDIKIFNNVNFDTFANNIVYKADKIVTINGSKSYENGFYIKEKVFANKINGIPIDDILTLKDTQNILGPIHIFGNVFITTDFDVKQNLNDIPMDYLIKSFGFDKGSYIINDDVTFPFQTFIDKLYVDKTINNIQVKDVLDKVDDSKTVGNITFKNTVRIKGNLYASDTINNVNLQEQLDKMVFKNINSEIYGNVIFVERVNVKETLFVDQNLDTSFVYDVDLNKWKTDAVYLNRGYLKSNVSFEKVYVEDDLEVKYLNEIDTKNLFLTKTNEEYQIDFDIGETSVFNNVFVGGLVNGQNLEETYRNSLMDYGDQEIQSPITFHGAVSFMGDLDVNSIDGQDMRRIVTKNTRQNLTANYVFKNNLNVLSEFTVSGLVDGVDFNEWKKRSLKKSANYTQNIENELEVEGEINFEGDVEGTSFISGFDFAKLAIEFGKVKEAFIEKHFDVVEASQNVCQDVNYVLTAAQKQIYFFKYLENLEVITVPFSIHSGHHFSHLNRNYLLVNERHTCLSNLYEWEESSFVKKAKIKTGIIDSLVPVYDKNVLFLVTNSKISDCGLLVQKTNVWKFEEDDLKLVHTLRNHSLIQQSLKPRTFYGLTDYDSEVIEYYLLGNDNVDIKSVTKWRDNWGNKTDDLAFVPRGLGTGLTLYNKKYFYKLLKDGRKHDEFYKYDYEITEVGSVAIQENCCFPVDGIRNVEIETIHVGHDDSRRSMVSVASHEDIRIKGRSDTIKIFENIFEGKIFHKIYAYKPSSLVSIEFGNNGESLLAFLENNEILQVYEYKGIEGFQNRLSKYIRGKQIVHFSVQVNENLERKIILVLGTNKIEILEAITEGNQLRESNIEC